MTPELNGTEQANFDRAAAKLARTFGLDLEDLRDAYAAKPKSLSSHFNSVADKKDALNENIFWTVVAAIVCWPIALWPGYKAFERYNQIENIGDTLRNEIALHKSKRNPAPAAP